MDNFAKDQISVALQGQTRNTCMVYSILLPIDVEVSNLQVLGERWRSQNPFKKL
uniref:Uncharacterized protein n=1 Tax=Nelumbo nucifera TaxID=4432 RepID=A0A822Y083_NELNU|nr:TPA_asm: hypothetical protein HUJ06_024521 [Nelumbo nucifera]